MKPSTCIKCPLYGAGNDFTSVEGFGTIPLALIGEASGGNEAQDELPFRPHGEAGAVLNRALAYLGVDREQVIITNILRCRPPQNKLEGQKYEWAAIDHCRQYLDAEMALHKPRAILALGGIAAKTLTGLTGKKLGIQQIRGFILPSVYGIPVIPTLHPAFLRRGKMTWFPLLLHDLGLALKVAKGERSVLTTIHHYNTTPTLEQAEALHVKFAVNPTLTCYFDIETAYSSTTDEDEMLGALDDEEEPSDEVAEDPLEYKPLPSPGDILQIQFSWGPGHGMALPWISPFKEIAAQIMALPNPKVGHNAWLFDCPALRRNGVQINGVVDDSMWAYHALQPDLPRGLQAVAANYCPDFGPWKHESGSNLAAYGCKDVDILARFWPHLLTEMRQRRVDEFYVRHVRMLEPILRAASERGLPMSPERQAEFSSYLKDILQNVDAKMQDIYPQHLKNLDPKEGFVRDPKDTTGMEQRPFVAAQTIDLKQFCGCVDLTTGEVGGWTKKVATRCEVCKGQGWKKFKDKVVGPVVRWCRVLPFKPSLPQVIAYMRFRGHKVPKAIGQQKASTAKLFLEQLYKSTKDPLYAAILEFRSHAKMFTSYMWSIGDDRRVHPTFTFSPATGQLAAVDPPVLTMPSIKGSKRQQEIARRFRQTVEARDGYYILECVGPETLILRDDMIWVRADEIQINDKLVGFDEELVKTGKRSHRKLKQTSVKSVNRLFKPKIRINTDMGVVECSTDHLWLGRKWGRAEWTRADKLKPGYKISYLTKPWDVNTSYDAAYLAGFLDGEGYVSGARLGFAQNQGDTLTHVLNLFNTSTPFKPVLAGQRLHVKTGHILNHYDMRDNLAFTGMRVVGSLRPVRLLKKIRSNYPGMATWGKNSRVATILSIESCDIGEVIAIETDSHTFIANGFLSHNCDKASFHACTFAQEAGDLAYYRLAAVIQDVHSFTTACLMHLSTPEKMLEMEDGELREFLGHIKKNYKGVRDGQAKPAGLGFNLGLGANKLFEQNRYDAESGLGFRTKYEAQKLIDTLRACFAKCAAYQRDIRILAANQKFLQTVYGNIRYFWDVMHRDKISGEWVPGEQSEAAIAFKVQGNAHGMLKEEILEMERLGYLTKYGLINIVHDSVMFEVEAPLLEEAVHNILSVMNAPSPVLRDPIIAPGGLIVPAEAKFGRNLADMKGFKL